MNYRTLRVTVLTQDSHLNLGKAREEMTAHERYIPMMENNVVLSYRLPDVVRPEALVFPRQMRKHKECNVQTSKALWARRKGVGILLSLKPLMVFQTTGIGIVAM